MCDESINSYDIVPRFLKKSSINTTRYEHRCMRGVKEKIGRDFEAKGMINSMRFLRI